MCQIIHSETGIIPGDLKEILASEFSRNRNGAGGAIIMDDGKVHYNHWFKRGMEGWVNPDPLVKWLLAKAKGGKIRQWAIHTRLATHGDKSKENCHPFRLYRSESVLTGKAGQFETVIKPYGLLMHNGVIDVDLQGSQSDTAVFSALCEGKSLPEIRKLLEDKGNGSRLLVALYDGTAGSGFNRLGTWHESTQEGLYFSTSPAFAKYYKSNYTARDNAWADYGMGKRYRSSESAVADYAMKSFKDAEYTLLPSTNGVQLDSNNDLPKGVSLNTNAKARGVVLLELDKYETYRDLEITLLRHASGPALDAAAVYIGRLRSALNTVCAKHRACTRIISEQQKEITNLKDDVEILTHFKGKDHAGSGKVATDSEFATLEADYENACLDRDALEIEVRQADHQIDGLMSDVEALERTIQVLAELVAPGVADGILEDKRREVEDEYPVHRPIGTLHALPPTDNPDDLPMGEDDCHNHVPDREPTPQELELLDRESALDQEREAAKARDTQRVIPLPSPKRSRKSDRPTVKIPRELDLDAPAVDRTGDASADASYEG